MTMQDVREYGIEWMVDEIGRLRQLVNQQRAEINADNEHMQNLHTKNDEISKELEWYKSAYNLVLCERDSRDREFAALQDMYKTLTAKYDTLFSFPNFLGTSESTLDAYVRHLHHGVTWVSRRLAYSDCDRNLPELITALRELATCTRKLYHQLEGELAKQSPNACDGDCCVNCGVDEGSPDGDNSIIISITRDSDGRVVNVQIQNGEIKQG